MNSFALLQIGAVWSYWWDRSAAGELAGQLQVNSQLLVCLLASLLVRMGHLSVPRIGHSSVPFRYFSFMLIWSAAGELT